MQMFFSVLTTPIPNAPKKSWPRSQKQKKTIYMHMILIFKDIYTQNFVIMALSLLFTSITMSSKYKYIDSRKYFQGQG